ncbi:MAG: hypothetical protein M3O46_20390, partial [Myxococcota bacterium]|nr:hypothetical protein [Myxococcota bacterium]
RELARPPQGQPIAERATPHGLEKARSPAEVSRAASGALAPNSEKIALGQRRYDWTPQVGGDVAKALVQTPRSRGPERGR